MFFLELQSRARKSRNTLTTVSSLLVDGRMPLVALNSCDGSHTESSSGSRPM